MNPKMIAACDQLNAAVRDTFDQYDINLESSADRMHVLGMVVAIASAVRAVQTTEDPTPENQVRAVMFLLNVILNMVKEHQ